MNYKLSVKEITERIEQKLSQNFGVIPQNATNDQFYKSLALIINDLLFAGRQDFIERTKKQNGKQVYYLCMEFLMGRSLKNCIFNLKLEKNIVSALKKFDVELNDLYAQESDAGLGNGGLGRLAACFLDGLATCGYPAMGYSLRYEYGIFKQKLIDGWQTEFPDDWLPGGGVWLQKKTDLAVNIKFDGHVEESWDGSFHHVDHVNYSVVKAVPYDMYVPGLNGSGVSVLRLWSSSAPGLDMNLFNQGDYMRAMETNSMAEVITKVLYPSDNHREGKSLRLSQQYFLVSASIQDIIQRHLAEYSTLMNLPDKVAIHINDTHPALVIPELMRILLDECGYDWNTSWDIVSRAVAYTNHTVMSEALECWPDDLFKRRLPRIYQIVNEINNRECEKLMMETKGNSDKVSNMAIISYGFVKMANLSVIGSHSVNGVSELHSDILKETVFKDFYSIYPNRFTNVTNGIAYHRWLCQANPKLTSLITELIGSDFIKDASKLLKLKAFADDKSVLDKIYDVKKQNKTDFSKYIKEKNGMVIDPNSIFDVQVKRMHEYKRQHLNALNILSMYQQIKENPNIDIHPRTFIFGAKAAPGYFLAKEIIQLICKIGDMIEADPIVREKIRVVYIEDYSVSLAELLMPSAEISEQISLAGTEASGTGNMKLMMNGAITLGTLDGANVEIHNAVGDENIILFGLKTPEVKNMKLTGYDPKVYLNNNPLLKNAIDALESNIFDKSFRNIANVLTNQDNYMVLADYADYCQARQYSDDLYKDKNRWNRMSLINIAASGIFSADRAIGEYAKNIWGAKKITDK